VFVSKYDTSGVLRWTEQLGTNCDDYSYGISADGWDNVYITGYTIDNSGGPNHGNYYAFLRKFDTSGSLLWTEEFDTCLSYGVSADDLGNAYICGRGFVRKYNDSGALLWSDSLAYDGQDVSEDGLGNIYVTGYGSGDAFVSKYDGSGTHCWTKRLGTSKTDWGLGVSADGLGNVYITGKTEGSLGGPNAGYDDAFVCKFDASGTFIWIEKFATSQYDSGIGVSTDGLGNVYFTGYTSLPFDNIRDGVFIEKICDVPEPSTFVGLLGLCLAGVLGWGRRGRFGER